MADSISVEHDGVTITTNTASEADLRTEMTTPEASAPPAESEAAAAARARDEKGRFAKTDATAPPADAPAPTETPAEPPARRRDDTLPRHNPIARLNQALAQKAEAERRAAALEAELARARQSGVTSPVIPSPQPSPHATNGAAPTERFPDWEQWNAAHPDEPDPYTAYQDAKWEWRLNQREARMREQWVAEQTQKARAETFQTRLQTGRTHYADYDQALTQADTLGLQVSAVMQDAIADSPQAADLVYYLATHPEECTQLAERTQYTPVAAADVVRDLLEIKLAPRAAASPPGPGPAAKGSVSTAKPPVTPVGSSPVVSDEPPGDAASAAEHARYWNRRLKVPGTK